MKVTIEELEAYLLDHYSNGGIDQSLFMKLVDTAVFICSDAGKNRGTRDI